MNSTFLDFGIIQIKWYSIFIFLAILTACIIIFQEAKKKHIDEDYLINLIFYGIIIGIVGARLYYVLFNLEYYLHNILEILMIWKGGLAIHGGIISTLIFIIIYSKKNNVNTLLILDIIVVGLIIAQSIGRWGNFFNGEAYGRVTTLNNLKNLHLPNFIIDGMFINGSFREPTFLYESIFSLLGFITMILIRKLQNLKIGTLTSIYLIWYGVERFLIEYLRSDSLMLGSMKVAQIVSIFAIMVGLSLLIREVRKEKNYHSAQF